MFKLDENSCTCRFSGCGRVFQVFNTNMLTRHYELDHQYGADQLLRDCRDVYKSPIVKYGNFRQFAELFRVKLT